MRISIIPLLAAVGLGAGCVAEPPPPPTAVAVLEARSGSSVSGRVELVEGSRGVGAHVELHGLAPSSEHGFHVHEQGDCSAPDAASAGGHFNPGKAPHGRPDSLVHHAGDLASVHADAAGNVKVDVAIEGVTLGEGPTSIVGRSLIVHRDPDDYTTQPSGNSGPRLACGVIIAK
jgi:Cu-Zn family superoxide dismutase